MNYQIIEKKEKILKIQVHNDDVVYISEKGIFLNDIFLEQPNDYNVAFFKKEYVIYGNLGKMMRYSLLSQKIDHLNGELTYYWENFENETVLISKNRRKDNNGLRIADYYFYNFENKSLSGLIFTNSPNIKILGKMGLIINYNTLKSLSLLTGEYEWELDLGNRNYIDSGEAKIKQIIDIWENELLVSITNGELVSINTSTGQIIFETHGLVSKIRTNESYKWWDFLLNPHLENGKLFELVGSQYYSFALNSQNLEILWQDDREEGYVSIKHTTYTEDYIYFTGSLENRFQPHLVGAFNRKTLSIDWVEDVNLSIDPKLGYVASLNQAPQVSEDKLYVLDSGGTLHIFERVE